MKHIITLKNIGLMKEIAERMLREKVLSETEMVNLHNLLENLNKKEKEIIYEKYTGEVEDSGDSPVVCS